MYMCPDCEKSLNISKKELIVRKLAVPKWIIEPFSLLQENIRTKLKCIVDDFYPYVSHQIIRYHHDITSEGKSVISSNKIYPQNFSWEAIVTLPADWHKTSLHCVVVQSLFRERKRDDCIFYSISRSEQHTKKILKFYLLHDFENVIQHNLLI
jgi:hypothetical protein